MSVGDIYLFIKNLLKKDDRGNIISPSDYQNIIEKASETYFNSEFEKYRIAKKVPSTLEHLVYTMDISVVSGIGNVTSYMNYFPIEASYIVNDKPINIQILDQKEYKKRLGTKILYPTNERPIATLYQSNFNVKPLTSATVKMDYLRFPNKPFFDYYYQNGKIITYIPPNTTYTPNINNPYRTGATSGTITSLSTEFEFKANSIEYIINIILSYYGLKLPDNLIYSDSTQKQMLNTGNL